MRWHNKRLQRTNFRCLLLCKKTHIKPSSKICSVTRVLFAINKEVEDMKSKVRPILVKKGESSTLQVKGGMEVLDHAEIKLAAKRAKKAIMEPDYP